MARTRLAERTTAQKVTVTPAAGAVFAALAAVLVLGPAMKFVAVVSTLGGLWPDSAAYGRIKGKIAHTCLTILMMFVTGIVLDKTRKGILLNNVNVFHVIG